MSQSIQAMTPSRRGEPLPAGDHPRPANLSGSLEAKRRQTSSWCSPRMFTQNDPVGAIFGHDDDPLSAKKATSGGSRDTEAKDPTASPTGPSSVAPVITVTPVVKWPRTWRNFAESKDDAGDMGRDRT